VRPTRTIVPAGGVCVSGTDVCVSGYSCINRMCVIRNGGVCSARDICQSGYSCVNGRCGVRPTRTIVPAGGVCSANSNCDTDAGYYCIVGRCAIAAGGVCRSGDYCRTGYACIGSRCAMKDTCQGRSVSVKCQEVGELAASLICDDKLSSSKTNYLKSCRSDSTCVCKTMVSSKKKSNECPQQFTKTKQVLCETEVNRLTRNGEVGKHTIDGELDRIDDRLNHADFDV
jgi:hypothetical protein